MYCTWGLATALRAKENDAFEAETADMNETLGLLNKAVKVLSAVQLVQTPEATTRARVALAQVRQKVVMRRPKFGDVLQKDLFDVLGSLEDAAPGAAFLAQSPGGLSGAAAGAKSYNSRSGSAGAQQGHLGTG